jgi:hypothetical protein
METTFQFLKDVRENVSNDAERRLVDIGVSRTIASFDEAKAMFMLLGLTRTLKVNTLLAEELFVTMTDHHDTRFLMYKTKGGTYRVLSELPVVAGAAAAEAPAPRRIVGRGGLGPTGSPRSPTPSTSAGYPPVSSPANSPYVHTFSASFLRPPSDGSLTPLLVPQLLPEDQGKTKKLPKKAAVAPVDHAGTNIATQPTS